MWGVFLDHDVLFKIKAGGKTQILVGGAGVAVDATVFATTVNVDASVESYIGTIVVGDDRFGFVPEIDRAVRFGIVVERIGFQLSFGIEMNWFKSIGGIATGTSVMHEVKL